MYVAAGGGIAAKFARYTYICNLWEKKIPGESFISNINGCDMQRCGSLAVVLQRTVKIHSVSGYEEISEFGDYCSSLIFLTEM